MEHELLLIKSFVLKDRSKRYTNLISTKKGRIKFRMYIPHFKGLNERYIVELKTEQHNPNSLYDFLKSFGASDYCYIISENSLYDGKQLRLFEALNALNNSGISFFISCIPGQLVYYEGEDRNSRLLLLKNQSSKT